MSAGPLDIELYRPNSFGNHYTSASMAGPDSEESEDIWAALTVEKSGRYPEGQRLIMMTPSATGSGCFVSVQTGELVCH